VTRTLKIAGGVAVVAVAALTGAAVLGRPKPPPDAATPAASAARKAVAVTAVPVAPRAVRRTVPVVGSLFGRDEVPVSAKVEGRVVRIHRDVGDTVKPGDVLFELDPTDFQLAVAEAERGLDFELSKL
jgi:multidrug efflux pump subunit AcrA (membrane-fusion protein)